MTRDGVKGRTTKAEDGICPLLNFELGYSSFRGRAGRSEAGIVVPLRDYKSWATD